MYMCSCLCGNLDIEVIQLRSKNDSTTFITVIYERTKC